MTLHYHCTIFQKGKKWHWLIPSTLNERQSQILYMHPCSNSNYRSHIASLANKQSYILITFKWDQKKEIKNYISSRSSTLVRFRRYHLSQFPNLRQPRRPGGCFEGDAQAHIWLAQRLKASPWYCHELKGSPCYLWARVLARLTMNVCSHRVMSSTKQTSWRVSQAEIDQKVNHRRLFVSAA